MYNLYVLIIDTLCNISLQTEQDGKNYIKSVIHDESEGFVEYFSTTYVSGTNYSISI